MCVWDLWKRKIRSKDYYGDNSYWQYVIKTHHIRATGIDERVRIIAALWAYSPVRRYDLAPYAWLINVSKAQHKPYARENPRRVMLLCASSIRSRINRTDIQRNEIGWIKISFRSTCILTVRRSTEQSTVSWPVMLHIILPNVAAPMRTTSPQRPTNIIVDSSVISRIIALNMIGEAKLAKGISRFAVDDKKPSFSVTGTSMTVGLKMQSSGWCEVPSCSTILRWYVGRNLMKWGRPLVPIAWNFNYLENIHHSTIAQGAGRSGSSSSECR